MAEEKIKGEMKIKFNFTTRLLVLLTSSSMAIATTLAVIFACTFSISFYDSSFSERFSGEDLAYYSSANLFLLNYLQDDTQTPPYELDGLSPKEQVHMLEVKVLMQKGFSLLKIAFFSAGFLTLLLYFQDKTKEKHLFREMFYRVLTISGIMLIFIIVISTLFFFNFNSGWTNFHKLAFTGDNWLLDNNSLLITMYPESFFVSILINIALYIFLSGFLLIFLGYSLKRIEESCFCCGKPSKVLINK